MYDTEEVQFAEGIETEVERVEVGAVEERVTTTPVQDTPVPLVPDQVTSTSSHEWERIRDYVLAEIERCHGPFPRDVRRENTIFMGFADRWEDQAMKIARYAFTEANGMWLNAPIGVHRFSRTADSMFAKDIVARMARSS